MSSLDLLRSVLEEDPTVGTGEATQKNLRRAEAIRRESVPGQRGALSTLDDVLNSSPPEPAPVRAQAIPAATEPQQARGEYRASEFAGDAGRKLRGALVGGSLGVPQGIQEAAKGGLRAGISGESRPVPFARAVESGMNWIMDATGFLSYAEQAKKRDEAVATFDRLVSGAKIPGLEGLAEYGSRVQRDIESGISDEGKRRIEGSTPRGNILKGELSFGDDPTLSGYALQFAGVLGSMAPTIATAIATRSPRAAAAVGGGQAANEASSTAREYIGNLSDEQLTEVSPYYNTLIRTGMSPEEARQIVTDKAAETGAALQGMVAAVGSQITGKLVTGAYDNILRRVGRNGAGATAAGAAFGALEEGVQETAEGVASDVGIRSQITDKEIGTDSAANFVLGALGGAAVGGVSGARSTPASTLDSYLSGAIDGARSNPEAVTRQARMALDPNRDVALDPRANVRPADSELGDVAITPGAAPDQQSRTAVATQQDRPEDLQGGQPTGTQTVASAQQQGEPKSPSLQTLDQILNSSEESLLAQVDAQNQPPPAQPPAPNQSFVDAVESIKSDLGIDQSDTLSLTEVTDNTRLKRFKSALEGAFGVKVHFVDFGEQLTTGSGRQLGAFNGYRHNDTILVDAKDVDLINTTWHELTHVLETRHADVYAKLRDTLVPNLDPEIRQNLITALNQRRQAEVGRDLSQQELDSELVAYAVGDIMQNPESLGQMFDSFGDPSVAKQFRDIVMDILDNLVKVIRGPQYIREQQALVKARKSVISAFAEYQKREAQKQMGAAPAAQPTAAPAAAQVATPATPTAPAATPQGAPAAPVAQAPAATPTIRFPTAEDMEADASAGAAPTPNFTVSYATPQPTAVGQQRTAVSPSGSENEPTEQTAQPATTGSTAGENSSGGQFMRPADLKVTGEFAGEMFLRAVRESPAEMTGLYIDSFGREINADLARELSPIYQQNPAAFASYVHEGASALIKLVFDQLLATASSTDVVRFTAGGGGSGKGFALGTLNLVNDSTIIYDGTLSKLATATNLINKATAAGLTTEVYYINADAKWSFGNALKRGTTKGRTVPLEALAEAHFGAANVIRQLDGMYKGKILVRVINNTPAGATYGAIDDVPRYNLDELKGWMYEELDRRVKDGYPLNLAAGFAPDKYSVEGRIGEPAERNDGAVRGEVRRGDAAPRRERVEQPEQPAAPARADGRQEGVSQPSSAPETIPSGTETQQRQYGRKVDVSPEPKQPKKPEIKRAGRFSYEELPSGRIVVREQANRVRSLVSDIAKASKYDEDAIAFRAVDAAAVVEAMKNAPKADKKIARDIQRRLGLTDEELNATSLAFQTGEAGRRAFDTPFAGDLTDTVEYLQNRRLESGLRTLNLAEEADRETLAKLVTAEVLAAIGAGENAQEWYDATIAKLMSLAALKYPELATDREAQMAFRIAIAVSSQGLNVRDNIKFAMGVYADYRKDGKFPERGSGESAAKMAGNFALANDMIGRLGRNEFMRFLETPFTAGELRAMGHNVDELVDEMVLGSSIFGPKIGFGFYSNLSGNFEPVTIDMWFMRTIGRLIGALRAFDEERFADQLQTFRGSFEQTGNDGIYSSQFDPALVERAKTDREAAITLARLVDSAHERDFSANKESYKNKTRVKSRFVNAASAMIISLDKPKDAPASGGERRLLRDVVRKAVDMVKEAHGSRVPPAALQALIWYPEQELYKSLGVDLPVTSQDYAGAITKLLLEEGYDERELRAAAESGSRRARQASVADVEGRDQGARQENRGGGEGEGSRTLTRRERDRILVSRTIRRYRTGDAQAPRAYKRKSSGDDGRVRVLDTPVVAEYQPELVFKNRLGTIGKPAPKMYELSGGAALFRSSILSAKSASQFGAAVSVYDEAAYATMRLFLSEDGKSGFALKDDGDIVSVFSGTKGAANAMLQLAVDEGGRKLDAFDTILPEIYADNGFRTVARTPWDESQKEPDWDKSVFREFNNGEPDVVFMVYDPENASESGGERVASYGDGLDAQAAALESLPKPKPKSTGQFSRKLVELAANQAPGAPQLFGISETPTVLRAVGAPRQLFVMEGKNVAKVVNPSFTGRVSEEDGGVRRNAAGFVVQTARRIPLTVDEIYAVPRLIADPIAVIKSDGSKPGRRYGYKVIIGMVKDGFPVVAIVHPDVRYGDNRASEIASVYPVNEPNSLAEMNRELNSSSLVYFDKGKAMALAARIGRNLPSLAKITPTLAKTPNSVPSRTLPVIPNSNWMRKLEIGGTGDPVDPNTGFARRVPTPGNRFTLPARTRREQFVENLFENRMSRVEDIQQAVEQQGGTLSIADAQGNVLGSTDLSSAVQRMRGAVRGRLDRFKKEVEIPIIEEAAKAGVNLEEVAQYLYAVYAPERNAIIQQRNPTQFQIDGGSGMTNAEATQIVASFRARRNFADIQRIANRVRNISVMTQNLLLAEGLVEPQVVAQWRADSPNYVPLRGFEDFDESTGNPLGAGSFGRMDPRNPFARTAKGRETRAGQILENILKDYSDAVVLAEKNKVYRLLLQFVQTNPDPALWQVNAPKVSRSYYKGGMTPLGYVQGTVRIAFEVNEDPAQTIAVRVKGRPVFIRVQDEGMLEDLQLTGAIGSGEQAKLYFRVWSGVMQTLAKLRTTLSPAFVFIDAIRNTETGGFWNLVKYGPKVAGKAYARLFKSARVAWKAEREGTWQGNNDTITIREPGQPPRTITLKEAYDMFRADGGKVGFLDIKEIEDIQGEIQRMFRAAQVAGSLDPRTYGTQLVSMIGKVEDLMLDAAGSVEIAMRFATYMARLEAGANRQEATDAAKNVTVNFDRKGKWTPHLGLLYMFANANIQGTRATYNLIFKSGKAGLALGGALAALGYAIAQLGSGVSGDDDEPYWDKQLYKNTKIKSLLFFTPDGNTVTIPMAYGSGFFVNLGYALSDLQRGVPLAKVAAFMRDSFFTHFSPFGSLENPATFASPTLLDPFAVVNMNMTEQGIPLMPDSSFEPGKPDSEKFWASTRGTLFQQLSSYMNDRTGGTVWYSGGIDVSPETLRYGYGFLTGGAGGFARDLADSIYLSTEVGLDAAVDKNKIPIVRSFYQQNTGKQNQTEFFRNADEAVRAMKEASDLFYAEKGREEKTADRLRDQRLIAELGYAVQSTKQALAAHREEEIRIVERRTNGSIDAATAEEMLSRIAKEKDKLYTDFNREFYRANPKTPD